MAVTPGCLGADDGRRANKEDVRRRGRVEVSAPDVQKLGAILSHRRRIGNLFSQLYAAYATGVRANRAGGMGGAFGATAAIVKAMFKSNSAQVRDAAGPASRRRLRAGFV